MNCLNTMMWGGPSITLIVNIEVEFDLKKVMEKPAEEIGASNSPAKRMRLGLRASYGHKDGYDFVYDDNSGALRVSHRYSHKRVDTKSVSSIAKQMIGYAVAYLEEVKASA